MHPLFKITLYYMFCFLFFPVWFGLSVEFKLGIHLHFQSSAMASFSRIVGRQVWSCAHWNNCISAWPGAPTWPPFHWGTTIWPPWRHVKTHHSEIIQSVLSFDLLSSYNNQAHNFRQLTIPLLLILFFKANLLKMNFNLLIALKSTGKVRFQVRSIFLNFQLVSLW